MLVGLKVRHMVGRDDLELGGDEEIVIKVERSSVNV